MPCFSPRAAFRPGNGGPLSFSYKKNHTPITIRCGNCIGCLIDDSRDWASRCMHEAKLHKHNCFVTLTYSDEHLPANAHLCHRDFQLFMKKLRWAIHNPPVGGSPILTSESQNHEAQPSRHKNPWHAVRFHMCGEYGPTTGRPHYHANLFGINFADKVPWKKTPADSQLYKSTALDKIWSKGQCSIGNLTWQTAAYTARYNMKKAGMKKTKNEEILNPDTGEFIIRPAEYHKMSRNPGIGNSWIKQNARDVYPRGTIILNAHEAQPPRYYDDYYRKLDPDAYEQLKSRRQHEQAKRPVDLTKGRQTAEATVTRAKLAFLKRNGVN